MLRTCALFVFKPSMEKCLNYRFRAHGVCFISLRRMRAIVSTMQENSDASYQFAGRTAGNPERNGVSPEIAKPLNELARHSCTHQIHCRRATAN